MVRRSFMEELDESPDGVYCDLFGNVNILILSHPETGGWIKKLPIHQFNFYTGTPHLMPPHCPTYTVKVFFWL